MTEFISKKHFFQLKRDVVSILFLTTGRLTLISGHNLNLSVRFWIHQLERPEQHKSLEEVHSSISTAQKSTWKRLLAFMGPAYLISVGYMDPGNWATDIAGGAKFGYKLLWVLLLSNLIAVLLQGLSARLGIVRGRDLAQASRETYPKVVNFSLYLLAEIAIASMDMAEVLGMAIGLNLLFDIPLIWGVLITFADTVLLLFLINKGMRKMEAFILTLVGIIGLSFLTEMFLAKPDVAELSKGFIPHLPHGEALFIAIGIIGATVMPHNLYLHSSLVQTRSFGRTVREIKEAIKFNIIDSAIALNLAFFVNAAILVLAASTFYKSGMFNVSEIQDAYRFLEPLMGTKLAPILFAVALIAAGQSSTLTGTLAGQIVMEGYLDLRLQPWVRRLITRLLAIVPAVIVIMVFGERSTGNLLILSQVILSLQLGFAVIPLIHFVSDKHTMGEFAIGPWTKTGAWLASLVIVGLNAQLVIEEVTYFIGTSSSPVLTGIVLITPLIFATILLLYITLVPFVKKLTTAPHGGPHVQQVLQNINKPHSFKRIAVAVDYSDIDQRTIQLALSMASKDTEFLLIHVVESAGAIVYGEEISDLETTTDEDYIEAYANQIRSLNYKVTARLGYGNPKSVIPQLSQEFGADILVMGSHGHGLLGDILFGTTISSVRHKVSIPVLVVKD